MRLVLHVDQEERGLSAILRLDDQIHLVPLACRHVREDFLVQELHRSAVHVGGNVRQEELDELDEEVSQQFLEELVVIDRVSLVHRSDSTASRTICSLTSSRMMTW